MKGSVYKKDGKWAYRFDLGPDPLTGRRRRASKAGFATRREAATAMRQAIAAYEKGHHVQPSRRSVEEYLNEWHTAVRPTLARTTWTKYRNYKDAYVIPVIGQTALQELTPVRLNLLYVHLLDEGRVHRRKDQPPGLAASSVAAVHRMLHRALRDAVKWDYLVRNPAEDANPPKVRRIRHQVWSPEQLRAFVTHVREDRLSALYLLVITTGLRRGQLVGVRRADVDLDAGTITPRIPRVVVDGKAEDSDPKTDNADRTLALDPVTVEALREHIKRWEEDRTQFGHDTDLLFCWPDGSHIHPDTITDWFQKHARAAGLPVIRLHDVRHSYATAALKSGVHPKVVSERLGHADVAFTLKTYSHVIPGMDRTAADQIAKVIFGDPGTPENEHGHESGHAAPSTPLTEEEGEG
ncbi:integrase family protein [Candidatus Protofrankia californiensis]|uniref:Integrase family protein n=1 Tax=Candidatus Protofrankia californiensis TaxID=1839754 RepID=A0A1C3NWI2_9ACTN|nr:integrase family protein [Candidatus Protofrankia californiensis]